MKTRDQFLRSLLVAFKALVKNKQAYHIKGPDELIEWPGKPKNIWPKADILVELPHHLIIIEIDEDSDPCRSVIKYWPYLENFFLNPAERRKLTLVEIWKRGGTIGRGYFELAQFIGKKFEKTFKGFSYISKERHDESPEQIARWIISVLLKHCAMKASGRTSLFKIETAPHTPKPDLRHSP